MKSEHGQTVIDGQLYLHLEVVAECYHVEVTWLREVYELGLLGDGRRVEATIAIPVVSLDRVARIIRMHFHYGQDLGSLELLLGDEDLDEV